MSRLSEKVQKVVRNKRRGVDLKAEVAFENKVLEWLKSRSRGSDGRD